MPDFRFPVRAVRRAALAITLLLAAGCAGEYGTAPRPPAAAEGGVAAARVAGGVRIENRTGHGVAYAVVNPRWLGLLALCGDPGPACLRLAPGRTVVVPEREFHGWSAGDAAAPLELRWWHVVPDGAGGHAPGSVQVVPIVR